MNIFRRTLEAQGLGARVARRTGTAAPRPRSTSLTSTRGFVSRRHKSRGDPEISYRVPVLASNCEGGRSASVDKSIYIRMYIIKN